LFIQESEQTVEDHARLLQPFAIIGEHVAQTVDHRLNPTSFEPLELVIFQIDVVNNFRQLAQAFNISQAKALQHRLKGAILSVMCEVCAEHVKWNGVGDGFTFGDKVKSGVFVDELFDQPGGSQPVNMYVASRNPTAALIILDGELLAPF
jgi:hypothetical protein